MAAAAAARVPTATKDLYGRNRGAETSAMIAEHKTRVEAEEKLARAKPGLFGARGKSPLLAERIFSLELLDSLYAAPPPAKAKVRFLRPRGTENSNSK